MSNRQLPQIVEDSAPLAEETAQELLGRDEQREQLLEHLEPVTRRSRPIHPWIHGPPGSGKTSLVRQVLGRLESRGVRTAYVNCWSAPTFFAVLDAIHTELRALIGEQREIAYKLERLVRIARERPLVIVLDEVDQMASTSERNATLYNLSRLDHAGVVCISQSRQVVLSLDERVASRLQPRFVRLPGYSEEETLAILRDRADRALSNETWCQADLERIAQVSAGDARVAIQALRVAAYRAEKRHASQIAEADLDVGLQQSSQLRRTYLLKTLPDGHRLLYRLAETLGPARALDLWKAFREHACKEGLPHAKRTFNHYKQYLMQARLLRERQGSGRRNNRIVEVVPSEGNTDPKPDNWRNEGRSND